jgi:alkanesulfonate monooxygenase SsuD/methylene tetrahydromethanopterin reductase-like flavin-dependent oxidoreductase (luciferase family)
MPGIQLAAVRDRMLALAGEVADGVVTSGGLAPEAIRRALAKTYQAATQAGRPNGTVEGVGFVIAALADSGDCAIEDARRTLAYLFRNRFVAEQLQATDARLDAEALAAAAAQRDWDTATRLVSDAVVDLCAIAGSPSACRAQMARYADTGLDVLVLVPLGGAPGGQSALQLINSL